MFDRRSWFDQLHTDQTICSGFTQHTTSYIASINLETAIYQVHISDFNKALLSLLAQLNKMGVPSPIILAESGGLMVDSMAAQTKLQQHDGGAGMPAAAAPPAAAGFAAHRTSSKQDHDQDELSYSAEESDFLIGTQALSFEGLSSGRFSGSSGSSEAEPGEEEPARQLFDPRMVAGGLSQLGTTANARPAYSTLTITGTTLGSADPLASCCTHVSCMQLANNQLTCITALGSLSSLAALNVSGNQLTQLLDLGSSRTTAAPCSSMRQSCSTSRRASSSPGGTPTAADLTAPIAAASLLDADFSCNSIATIRDLSGFSRLHRLVLDGNQVERVGRGLAGLVRLRELSVRDNLLESCEGLQGGY